MDTFTASLCVNLVVNLGKVARPSRLQYTDLAHYLTWVFVAVAFFGGQLLGRGNIETVAVLLSNCHKQAAFLISSMRVLSSRRFVIHKLAMHWRSD